LKELTKKERLGFAKGWHHDLHNAAADVTRYLGTLSGCALVRRIGQEKECIADGKY